MITLDYINALEEPLKDAFSIGSQDTMAEAEKAWTRFTDKDFEEDDYLIRLAECLLLTYAGTMPFLNDVQRWYRRNYEITPKQARAVLNIFITDKRYVLPLMMILNFGVKSPSDHLLTKATIYAEAEKVVKSKVRETHTTVNPFTNVTMEEVRDVSELEMDEEGRIRPKAWKVNVMRKRINLSDAKQHKRPSTSNTHGIHSDSWIKGDTYYIVTTCGLYRDLIPDPFGLMTFTEDEVNCGKCLDRLTAPDREELE